jgi:hypothetical protein
MISPTLSRETSGRLGPRSTLFYCSTAPTISAHEGGGGSDVVLKPGQDATDWNSPDPTGPIGIAAYPGDLLLGCLSNPSQGEDNPATKTCAFRGSDVRRQPLLCSAVKLRRNGYARRPRRGRGR